MGEPLPKPSGFACHWSLDPSVVYLNHGSFGATPKAVQEARRAWEERLEAEPVRFFVEDYWGLMDSVRAAIGELVKWPAECIVPVANATAGVAAVLTGLGLGTGDELLINQHEYPACRSNARAAGARTGATVVDASVPFPIRDEDEAVSAIMSRVTGRTRAALFSHVTSPTGLVLPVERLAAELESRGVFVLIDGAHAPGMIEGLDLSRINAHAYVANNHKWLCAPKASGFLAVRPDVRARLRPHVLSNFAESPRPGRDHFTTEFDYVGTQSVSAWLAVPDAIRCLNGLVPGGIDAVARRNRELCLSVRRALCGRWGVEAPAPESMIGSIATLLLPDAVGPIVPGLRYADALQEALVTAWNIQVPVWFAPGTARRTLRVSCQLYNAPEQYEYLARAVLSQRP